MKKVKVEVLLSLLAVLISTSTMFVYLYQTSLMEQQLKMSVWPFLSVGPSWGPERYEISLTNKGVGPAIIEEVNFFFGDSSFSNIHELMNFVPESLRSDFTYSSVYPGLVVMAGEDLEIFSVHDVKSASYLQRSDNGGFSIQISYKSVYGDRWISDGQNAFVGQ